MYLRASALPDVRDAGECVRMVRARAGGHHRAPRCTRVKVATGGGRDATMENKSRKSATYAELTFEEAVWEYTEHPLTRAGRDPAVFAAAEMAREMAAALDPYALNEAGGGHGLDDWYDDRWDSPW